MKRYLILGRHEIVAIQRRHDTLSQTLTDYIFRFQLFLETLCFGHEIFIVNVMSFSLWMNYPLSLFKFSKRNHLHCMIHVADISYLSRQLIVKRQDYVILGFLLIIHKYPLSDIRDILDLSNKDSLALIPYPCEYTEVNTGSYLTEGS